MKNSRFFILLLSIISCESNSIYTNYSLELNDKILKLDLKSLDKDILVIRSDWFLYAYPDSSKYSVATPILENNKVNILEIMHKNVKYLGVEEPMDDLIFYDEYLPCLSKLPIGKSLYLEFDLPDFNLKDYKFMLIICFITNDKLFHKVNNNQDTLKMFEDSDENFIHDFRLRSKLKMDEFFPTLESYRKDLNTLVIHGKFEDLINNKK